MRILLFGGSTNEFSLEKSYERAFLSLGHELKSFSWRNYKRPKNIFISKVDNLLAMRKFYKFIKTNIQSQFSGYDLVIIFKSVWLDLDLLLLLRNKNKIIIHFNPDNPFDIVNGHKNLIKTIPHYDYYFTWSHQILTRIKNMGYHKVFYLPFGWDPVIHPEAIDKSSIDLNWRSDLAFIGNWTKNREKMLLNTPDDASLKIWGPPNSGWLKSKYEKIVNNFMNYAPRGREFSYIAKGSLVNINILRKQNEGSLNMRTFELTGAGGVMLTTDTFEQREMFGNKVFYFQNELALKNNCNYILNNYDKLIDSNFHRELKNIMESNSYENRVSDILKVIR